MQRDLVFGCGTLALSAGYYFLATSIPRTQLDDAIGPQGLPKTYAVLLAGLSGLQIVRSLAGRRDAADSVDTTSLDQLRMLWRAAGMLVIGLVYLIVVSRLGYILSVASLIFVTIHYQGGAAGRRAAAVAVAGTLLFWVLFVLLLGIPQPAGFWPALL